MPDTAATETPAPGAESERERSTIAFPYNDLDDAEEIAKALHQLGGSAQFDQLAAAFKVKADTGAFRMRLQVARLFGLITYGQGTTSLTPLGRRICDPTHVKSARSEAFLTIPLYRRVYEQFMGTSLPPSEGLEAALVTLGVAKKQKDKARQTLQRSAKQAGFFWAGQDRLVLPSGAPQPGNQPPADPPPADPNKNDANRGFVGGGGGGGHHQLIEGLIKTLPVEGSEWSIEDRHRWLQLAAGIFDFVYKQKNTGGDRRVLSIDLKDSAK